MDSLWKSAAIAVTAAVLALTLKKRSEEQSFLLGILAAVMILTGMLNAAESLTGLLQKFTRKGDILPGMLVPVMKSLGLAILGKLTESFCRDAGQSALASAMELATSCAILCAALPLLESLSDTVFSAFS